jgi:hypothetical protein
MLNSAAEGMRPNAITRIGLARLCCLSGLIGSLLFLSGDMLFYGSWSSGANFHAYQTMAERPLAKLVIGGAIGPIAALFSAVGMGIFYLALESSGRKLACVVAVLFAVMVLIGGSYHALYAGFGFAAKTTQQTAREILMMQVTSLRNAISYPMYAAGAAGTLLVYWLALWRRTRFPRWLLLFLPTTLSMASSVFRSYFVLIPAPLGGIIRGGWINGSFVLFFAVATGVFWRFDELHSLPN